MSIKKVNSYILSHSYLKDPPRSIEIKNSEANTYTKVVIAEFFLKTNKVKLFLPLHSNNKKTN